MSIIEIVLLIVFCAISSFFLYGIWKLEDDRYNYKKKHGVDPKYHGWDLDKDSE